MSARVFDGLAAIVTGAARGIGSAIAERLSAEGAAVAVADIDGEAARAVAQRLASAVAIPCNVAEEASVEACIATTLASFGRLDVVVNNAGSMIFRRLAELSQADWTKVLAVDLVGPALFTRAAFARMGPEGGAIVNVSSVHALRTTPEVAPYAAAKAGLLSLTRSAAIEGRARKIRVNAVLPGAIDTAMLRDNPNVRSGVETIAPEELGAPADVAAAVAFLASREARFVTGASLVVDGGRLAWL